MLAPSRGIPSTFAQQISIQGVALYKMNVNKRRQVNHLQCKERVSVLQEKFLEQIKLRRKITTMDVLSLLDFDTRPTSHTE